MLLNVRVDRNNSLHFMVIFSGNGLWASMINSTVIALKVEFRYDLLKPVVSV